MWLVMSEMVQDGMCLLYSAFMSFLCAVLDELSVKGNPVEQVGVVMSFVFVDVIPENASVAWKDLVPVFVVCVELLTKALVFFLSLFRCRCSVFFASSNLPKFPPVVEDPANKCDHLFGPLPSQ